MPWTSGTGGKIPERSGYRAGSNDCGKFSERWVLFERKCFVTDTADKHQRGYKYRLYPTPLQEEALRGWQETHRRLWNSLLGIYYDAIREGVTRKKTCAECEAEARAKGITEPEALEAAVKELKFADGLRYKLEVGALFKAKGWTSGARLIADRAIMSAKRKNNPFFASIGYHVLDELVRTHVRAWDSYFAGLTKMPTFKEKVDTKPSVRTAKAAAFKVHDQHIELSSFEFKGKRSLIKFHKHRPLPSTPTRVVISSQGNRWFVVFGVVVDAVPMDPNRPSVGIDRGVSNLLTDSTGRSVPGFRMSERKEARKHWLERRIAKKEKGSSRWHKLQNQVNRLQRHVADARADVLHKQALHYAQTYSTIVLEDLAVKNMTKTAKGTKESPGVNVAQKAGLNAAILSQGWGMFGTMLSYKTALRGGTVLHVNAKHTSQTCGQCGHVDAGNRLTQAQFKCLNCGHTANADVNAAKVIWQRGTNPATTSVKEKKPSKKLFTVTGRKKTGKTSSVEETSPNAAVGRTVKLPVEDGETVPPDETGSPFRVGGETPPICGDTTYPSTTVSQTVLSSTKGTLPTSTTAFPDMLENTIVSPSENTDFQNDPAG